MSGPIYSLKFVHNAIAAELRAFQSDAQDAESIGALVEAFAFFCELMHFHHLGEETVIFPLLDDTSPGYAATYLFDHAAEREHFASLKEQMLAAREKGSLDVQAFVEELSGMVKAALTHIEKENTLVLPELASRYSPQEQGEIVGKALAVIPKEKMPALVPWIVTRQNDDQAEAYVRGIMAAMPALVFAAAKGWIEGGVPEGRWRELCRRVPELATQG